MALALEQSHLANLREVLGVLQPFAAADPGAMDFVDVDKVGPALFRAKGLPEEFIREAKEVEKLRAGRAQAQQMAQAQQAAGAVKDLGGAEGLEKLSGLVGR